MVPIGQSVAEHTEQQVYHNARTQRPPLLCLCQMQMTGISGLALMTPCTCTELFGK